MKILHVTRQFLDISHGGVEFHVHELATAMQLAGHSVTVVRISSNRGLHEMNVAYAFRHLKASGSAQDGAGGRRGGLAVEFLRRIGDNVISLKHVWAFLRIVRAHDVVHFHDFVSIIVLSRVSSWLRPTFWTNHLGEFLMLQRLPQGRRITRLLTRGFTFAFGPSNDLADARSIGCPSAYLANGVNTTFWKTPTAEERVSASLRLGLQRETPYLLVPRRWAPTKGVDFVAERLDEIAECGLNVAFVGAGNSGYEQYRQQVQAAIARSALRPVVVASASPAQLRDWYWAAAAAVIPSRMEATSLAALEAMACGTPVIATSVGGLPELIVDGESGLLVSPTADGVEQGVKRFVQLNHQQRSAISQRALLVAEAHSWAGIANEVCRRYADCGRSMPPAEA